MHDTSLLQKITTDLLSVSSDVAPVVVVALFFQFVILRRKLPYPKMIAGGFVAVIIGLYLFVLGLDLSVFPIGEALAQKLAQPGREVWALFFAFAIGYAATIAEPALLAVAVKAEEATSGGLNSFALRNAVAIGVAFGLTLGVFRIFSGDPLWLYIMSGYIVTLILTWYAPKEIVPLAYDSGGVTTSTITVPLVAAFGIGLATNTPGRNPIIDGFGLIAFASVFPMISVLSYSIFVAMINKNKKPRR